MEPTDEDKKQLFKEVRRRAISFAKSKRSKSGGLVDPEDFAQEVIVYMLEKGLSDPGLLIARYADFMRSKFGNVRIKQKKVTQFSLNKQNETLLYNEIHDNELKPINSKIDFLVDRLYLNKYFRKVPLGFRILYVLYHKYGFEQVELASIAGLSYSRICQHIKTTQLRIDFNIKDPQRPKKS